MNRHNDNANNTREEPQRKTDGKDGTTSRDQNPKENMKDIKRAAETGNGIITVDTGRKKERAKTKDTEIETKRNEGRKDKKDKVEEKKNEQERNEEERKGKNESDKEQSKEKDEREKNKLSHVVRDEKHLYWKIWQFGRHSATPK